MSEVLPYLEVEQGNPDQVEKREEIQMPNLKGKTIKEAEEILKENELEIKINNETEEMDKEEVEINTQIPEPGIKIYKGSCIYINY